MKKYPPFGRFCVEMRRNNGQLLIQMADAIGVRAERLSTAEIGESSPRIEWLPAIVEFLDLSELDAKRLERILLRSAISAPDRDLYEPFSSAAFSDLTSNGKARK